MIPRILASVTIPYSTVWSKNRMWRQRRGGGRYLDADTRAAREALAAELRADMMRREITGRLPKKLHVSIHVVRPDMRSDPINTIDAICDAVQIATGIDDRCYECSLTWAMAGAGRDPSIRVEVTIR